ncbi:hypothetical protein [Streptoalloteichus hindustanus]|uniref:hypothetical protein n=1 Tax=Streptoalloteichus hindustanus TaxID=2017 RepID=UPI000935F525|nr:hypothetical protein [Streptoalloteichus hindustanus]
MVEGVAESFTGYDLDGPEDLTPDQDRELHLAKVAVWREIEECVPHMVDLSVQEAALRGASGGEVTRWAGLRTRLEADDRWPGLAYAGRLRQWLAEHGREFGAAVLVVLDAPLPRGRTREELAALVNRVLSGLDQVGAPAPRDVERLLDVAHELVENGNPTPDDSALAAARQSLRELLAAAPAPVKR